MNTTEELPIGVKLIEKSEQFTAPCESCDLKNKCKEKELSCRAFNFFVRTGYLVEREPGAEPSKRWYGLIFRSRE